MKMNFKNKRLSNKIKSAVLVAVLSVFAVGASAQSTDIPNGYITNGAWDNWFIQGGAGVNMYLGGQNGGKFLHRNVMVYDIAVGKWTTPTIGFRLQYNNSRARQYASVPAGPYADFGLKDGVYLQKFNFQNLHADVLWNLSSEFGGYNQNRLYEAVVYAGFGVARAASIRNHQGPTNYEYAANFGLINKFRISNAFDINLELRSTILPSSFDGVICCKNDRINVMAAATAGLTYRFGRPKGFMKASDLRLAPVVLKDEAEINRLKESLAQQQALNNRLQEELRGRKAPETVVMREGTPSVYNLFFTIGRSTLDAKNLANLESAAKMIKDNPSKTFRIETYADKQTGSARRNQELTEQRAKFVFDRLVALGVNPDQLVKVPNGATIQPFSQQELNRVAIIMN